MDLREDLRFNGKNRTVPIRGIVLHHTGGENPHRTVINTLLMRKLSVHFIIDNDGVVWETLEPHKVALHAGKVNAWTIGIEIVNRGVGMRLRGNNREIYQAKLPLHKPLKFQKFYPQQVEACRELVFKLCKEYNIPFQFMLESGKGIYVPRPTRRVFTDEELSTFQGILGHMNVNAKKVDPSPHLLDELCWGPKP